MNINSRAAVSSVLAAILLSIAPSAGAATGFSADVSMPDALDAAPAAPAYDEASEYYGRYRRYHRHRRRGPDAGDIIAGIGIIAGIAIIADAVSKNSKRRDGDRDYDSRTERNDERDYDRDRHDAQDRRVSQGYPANDLGSAVSACSTAAEQSAGGEVRVQEIRSATRDGKGWRVSGDLDDARSFDCGVSNRGVDFVQLGDLPRAF